MVGMLGNTLKRCAVLMPSMRSLPVSVNGLTVRTETTDAAMWPATRSAAQACASRVWDILGLDVGGVYEPRTDEMRAGAQAAATKIKRTPN